MSKGKISIMIMLPIATAIFAICCMVAIFLYPTTAKTAYADSDETSEETLQDYSLFVLGEDPDRAIDDCIFITNLESAIRTTVSPQYMLATTITITIELTDRNGSTITIINEGEVISKISNTEIGEVKITWTDSRYPNETTETDNFHFKADTYFYVSAISVNEIWSYRYPGTDNGYKVYGLEVSGEKSYIDGYDAGVHDTLENVYSLTLTANPTVYSMGEGTTYSYSANSDGSINLGYENTRSAGAEGGIFVGADRWISGGGYLKFSWENNTKNNFLFSDIYFLLESNYIYLGRLQTLSNTGEIWFEIPLNNSNWKGVYMNTYNSSGSSVTNYFYIDNLTITYIPSDIAIETNIYSNGYSDGYEKAKQEYQTSSYNKGYKDGYNTGLQTAEEGTFLNLLTAIIDAPVKSIISIFDFEILGYNMKTVILALVSTSLVIAVLRLFTRKE